MDNKPLPAIIITGASGFIGRYLIEYLRDNYRIFALARRTQREARVVQHRNITWMLVDISKENQLEQCIGAITDETSIEFIIHLAAYYEFSNTPNPAFEETNVQGTLYLLEHARKLNIRRFIFASSLVACRYPVPGDAVNELTAPNAKYPYAVSKRKGEELMMEYSQYFPCATIRFAAVFSDCCEYVPLYFFLKTWLSNRWNSCIIGGSGKSALPFIHINCVEKFFTQIMDRTDQLADYECLIASGDRPVSHLELFNLATRYYYGRPKHAFFLPKYLAWLGVAARDILGRLINKRPFERLWMINYVDKSFASDSTYTRDKLEWRPLERHSIQRRLLFMIENMKSSPGEWDLKNTARIVDPGAKRPHLILAEEMHHMQGSIIEQVIEYICARERKNIFHYYQDLEEERLKYYIEVVYNHLISSVRNGDRSLMISFAQFLANVRHSEGVHQAELCAALKATGDIIESNLLKNNKLSKMKILIHDYITLALQLAIDEVKDSYDRLDSV